MLSVLANCCRLALHYPLPLAATEAVFLSFEKRYLDNWIRFCIFFCDILLTYHLIMQQAKTTENTFFLCGGFSWRSALSSSVSVRSDSLQHQRFVSQILSVHFFALTFQWLLWKDLHRLIWCIYQGGIHDDIRLSVMIKGLLLLFAFQKWPQMLAALSVGITLTSDFFLRVNSALLRWSFANGKPSQSMISYCYILFHCKCAPTRVEVKKHSLQTNPYSLVQASRMHL